MSEMTRRDAVRLAAVGVAAVVAGGAVAADDKKMSAKEVREFMKNIGGFSPADLEAITDDYIARISKEKPKEASAPSGGAARVIYSGTGLVISGGQWFWYGPGCNGTSYYIYNPKPGAYWRAVGTCPNGKTLYEINVV